MECRLKVLEDALFFSGNGTTIIPDVKIDYTLMRARIECDGKIEYSIPGMVSFMKSRTAEKLDMVLVNGVASGDIYIQGSGEWKLSIEPLALYGELDATSLMSTVHGTTLM